MTRIRMRLLVPAAIACAAIVAKLLLVSGSEIVSENNDAIAYATFSLGNPLGAIGPNPGYPLWLWACRWLGVPQRIAIECLYLLSCGLLAVSAFGLRRPLPCVLLFAILAFAPPTFFMFDHVLSDGFDLTLGLMALAASVWILRAAGAGTWAQWMALGAVVAALLLTRAEQALVAACALLLPLALVVREWSSDARTRLAVIARIGARTALAVITAGAMLLAVDYAHWRHEGVWARSMAELPSHLGLLTRIASIETRGMPQRFVPISREARLLAYRESPSLRRLEPLIEDPSNPYRQASESVIGLPGEIGAGWIWHVFNDAAARAGVRSLRALDELYRTANDELDAAFAAGRLRRHFVLHPLLGAHPRVWIPHLPESFLNVAVRAATAGTPALDEGYLEETFDAAVLRRTALVRGLKSSIAGWAVSADGTAQVRGVDVELGTWQGSTFVPRSSYETRHVARPDVVESFRREGRSVPVENGFSASLPVASGRDVRLRFALPDGSSAFGEKLVRGAVATARDAAGRAVVVYGMDALPDDPLRAQDVRWTWMLQAAGAYSRPSVLIVLLGIVAAGACVLAWGARAGRKGAADAVLVMVLMAGWIVLRIAFYAVLDAAAWGAEPRYVMMSGVMTLALAVTAVVYVASPGTAREA